MVSNAALRSSDTRSVGLPASAVLVDVVKKQLPSQWSNRLLKFDEVSCVGGTGIGAGVLVF